MNVDPSSGSPLPAHKAEDLECNNTSPDVMAMDTWGFKKSCSWEFNLDQVSTYIEVCNGNILCVILFQELIYKTLPLLSTIRLRTSELGLWWLINGMVYPFGLFLHSSMPYDFIYCDFVWCKLHPMATIYHVLQSISHRSYDNCKH